MALPVTVYRWDDDGAPQFSSNPKPSECFEILKKCLVEGYGNKQSLGWIKHLESTDGLQLVFRNSESDGTGHFVKFWAEGDNYSNPVFYRTAPVINSLNDNLEEAEGSGYQCATGSSSVTRRWYLIGTSTAFYFVSAGSESGAASKMATGVQNIYFLFVGDIDSLYSNDQFKFVSLSYPANNVNSAGWNIGLGYLGPRTDVCKMYETDGGNPKIMELCLPFQPSQSSAVNREPNGQLITAKPFLQIKSYTPYSTSGNLLDSEGVNVADSNLHPAIRGLPPGMIQSDFHGYSNSNWPVTKDIFGEMHYLLPNTHVGACGIWVNAEKWYE